MNKFYAVLIVIFFIFYFADRAKRRKAKRHKANQCPRCGYALEAAQWEFVSVNGGPPGAVQTPACPWCARLDGRVRTLAWSLVGLALAATAVLLFLTQ
jgi:hypothetical protein